MKMRNKYVIQLQKVCMMAGYEVDTCYDGEEALECILAEDYDLIVLDLNLPGMDGMEILKGTQAGK